MTVYLVTSLHRSISSMMMRCLEAGGMDMVSGREQDKMNINAAILNPKYIPNPNGFYAMDDEEEFERSDFFAEYANKLLKIPPNRLLGLPKGDCWIIFIKRNPEEILASMKKFLPFNLFPFEPAIWFYDPVVGALIKKLKAKGYRISIVDYSEVIKNPTKTFQKLKLPINIRKAVKMVDPKLYRNIKHG